MPDIDPYALTPDKSGEPAYTIPIAAAPAFTDTTNDGGSATTTKKGKFFTSGREIASKLSGAAALESLKRKLPALVS